MSMRRYKHHQLLSDPPQNRYSESPTGRYVLYDDYAALRAERDALAKDAARYRYMRSKAQFFKTSDENDFNPDWGHFGFIEMHIPGAQTHDDIDAVIDSKGDEL